MGELVTGLFGTGPVKYIDITLVPAKQPQCGVKPHLFKKYDFDDHIWKNPTGLMPTHFFSAYGSIFNALLEFSKNVIYIKNSYWIKIPSVGWIEKSNATLAKKDTINLFYGQQFGTIKFDQEFCEMFFSGIASLPDPNEPDKMVKCEIGSCPQMEDIACIPYGPDFIQTSEGRFLNVWVDKHIPGDVTYDRYGKEFLWLMYRSLCNGNVLDADEEIEKEIVSQEVLAGTYCSDNNFKKLVMFCAALVQYPGINLLINLFLLGELHGIGKGTLIDLMKLILGHNVYGKLLQADVEAGWTDHLMNKVLIEVDELDPEKTSRGKGFWNKFFKRETIVDIGLFRARNKGAHRPINIANYLVTANNEEPIMVEASDRRNQFIRTTYNTDFVHKAGAFQEVLFKKYPNECAAGLAAFFERVDIDLDYVNTVYHNEIKEEAIQASRSLVEQWLLEDEGIEFGKVYRATDLYKTVFKSWINGYAPTNENRQITQNMFSRWMTKAARMAERSVTKSKEDKTNRACYTIDKKTVVAKTQAHDRRVVAIDALSKKHGRTLVTVADVVVEPQMRSDFKTGMDKIRDALNSLDAMWGEHYE